MNHLPDCCFRFIIHIVNVWCHVQCLAQGHVDMWTGEVGERNRDQNSKVVGRKKKKKDLKEAKMLEKTGTAESGDKSAIISCLLHTTYHLIYWS